MRGFALNERRLAQDNDALNALAARIRALRADERNIYQSVRDVFAFSSIDYSKESSEAHSFFARLQDKFLYAITWKTAAQIKLDRANHRLPSMGPQSMRGEYPERADVDIGRITSTALNCMVCTFYANSSCCSLSRRRSADYSLRWLTSRRSLTN